MSGTAWRTAMRCSTPVMSSRVEAAFSPAARNASDSSTTALPSPRASASISWNTTPRSALPSIWRTAASSSLPEPKAMAWSVRLSASRMEPRAARASSRSACGSAGTLSCASTCSRCCSTVSGAMGRRLNCRQRLSTVTGTFCGSVVASTNFRYSGGSSSVFSMALKAVLVSMCTSSIMKTLKRPCTGL